MNILDRWSCRRVTSLLVPFAEKTLSSSDAVRVKAHLDRCPACRAEAAVVADMGRLLRQNRPAAPEPAVDLWSRIQAEIAPEPVAQPTPRRAASWRSSLALPAVGGLAAAMVVLVVFVRNGVQPIESPVPRESDEPQVARVENPVPPVARDVAKVDAIPEGSSFNPRSRPKPGPVNDPFRQRTEPVPPPVTFGGGKTAHRNQPTPLPPAQRPAKVGGKAKVHVLPTPNVPKENGASTPAITPPPPPTPTPRPERYNLASQSSELMDSMDPSDGVHDVALPAATSSGTALSAPGEPGGTGLGKRTFGVGGVLTAEAPEAVRVNMRGNRVLSAAYEPENPMIQQDVPATASAVEETLTLERRLSLFRY